MAIRFIEEYKDDKDICSMWKRCAESYAYNIALETADTKFTYRQLDMKVSRILKTDLDIRIAFLHAANRRSQSLNLDIAELFKPVIIDRLIFALFSFG